jgi:hypothetical protein
LGLIFDDDDDKEYSTMTQEKLETEITTGYLWDGPGFYKLSPIDERFINNWVNLCHCETEDELSTAVDGAIKNISAELGRSNDSPWAMGAWAERMDGLADDDPPDDDHLEAFEPYLMDRAKKMNEECN